MLVEPGVHDHHLSFLPGAAKDSLVGIIMDSVEGVEDLLDQVGQHGNDELNVIFGLNLPNILLIVR